MVERITTDNDLRQYLNERQQSGRLREAISFCKEALEVTATHDRALKAEERLGFEKCLTENYLIKKGMDYIGKRDLIYIDLYGQNDLMNMRQAI